MSTRLKLLLFVVIIVVPVLLSLTTASVSFSRAQSVEFCGSCHVMTPWMENVTGQESDSLAAEHYKRRWIQREQCFTCHSNYGFLGPLEAKIKGVRHVIAFYVGVPDTIELYEDFPNENCLQCHIEAKGFLEDSNHEPLADILSGKDRCVECHEAVHGVEQDAAEADEGEPAAGAEGGDDDAGDEAGKPAGDSEDGEAK